MKSLKKLLCGVLTAAMLTTAAVMPAAAEENITVKLNGTALSFDTPPQTINDRTMVPLRAIFEALGASVDWNDDTQTVTSTKNGTTIQLTINSSTMYVNGNAVTLDSPACMVNDRTLVPVRAIAEAYNTTVSWDEATQTVNISTDSAAAATTTAADDVSGYTSVGPIVLNYDYGPMTVECYYTSGDYWRTNNVSSFVFTACEETLIGKYLVHINMQGVTDYDMAEVKVYFYDSNNRVIDEENLFDIVTPNEQYNIEDSFFIDNEVIENSVAIKFYSYSGHEASGATIPNVVTSTSGTLDTSVSAVGSLLLNYEYGPMTVENHHSTGNYWYTNNISSFVITRCEESSSGKYLVYVNMQGTSDYGTADVKMYFYDAAGNLLGEEWFYHNVPINTAYNVLIDQYVEADLVDNAATIKFYSYTGEEAK